MSAGTPVMAGGVVSCTVTVKVFGTAWFPAASCAWHVTVVVVIANVEPDAGVQTGTMAVSSGSVAVTVYVTTAPLDPVASRVRFAGTVITGGVVSIVERPRFHRLACDDRRTRCAPVAPNAVRDATHGSGVAPAPVQSAT